MKKKGKDAAARAGMLPADERQEGHESAEAGHRKMMLTSSQPRSAALAPASDPFSSPFGAGEDKARARGIHQQSIKEAAAPAANNSKLVAPTDRKKQAGAEGAKAAADENAPITRTTMIVDIVYKYPEAIGVLTEAGLYCIGCQLSVYDDFQTGCAIHGFDDATIDSLVVKMNEAVSAARKKG